MSLLAWTVAFVVYLGTALVIGMLLLRWMISYIKNQPLRAVCEAIFAIIGLALAWVMLR